MRTFKITSDMLFSNSPEILINELSKKAGTTKVIISYKEEIDTPKDKIFSVITILKRGAGFSGQLDKYREVVK